jgi:hypothetical protein
VFYHNFLGNLPGGQEKVPSITLCSCSEAWDVARNSQGTEVSEVRHLAVDLPQGFEKNREKMRKKKNIYIYYI